MRSVSAHMALRPRQYVLTCVLALAFTAMAISLTKGNDPSTNVVVGLSIFGLLLIVIPVLAMQNILPLGSLRSSGPSWVKCAFGSIASAFALWLLGSIALLPFVGYRGFELVDSRWFGFAIGLLALALFPVARRYLK